MHTAGPLRSADGRLGTGRLTVHPVVGPVWSRPWVEVADLAIRQATHWQQRGLITDGSVVAFSGDTSPGVIVGILAAWIAGATVTVAPSAGIGFRPETVIDTCVRTPPAVWCVDPAAADGNSAIRKIADVLSPSVTLEMLTLPEDADPARAMTAADHALAVLQPTSGSTQSARAVRVTASNVEANLRMLRTRLQIDPAADRLLAWLPLYHDMGLIGFLAQGWVTFMDTTLLAPEMFIANPTTWISEMGRQQSTVTAAPNFAYGLLASKLSSIDVSLASLRLALCGAAAVHLETMDRFASSGQTLGLDPSALTPVYGLAEATLAVTIPAPGTGVKTVPGNSGSAADVQVALGSALDDTRVQIVDPDTGLPVRDGALGEITVSGPHVSDGYQSGTDISRTHIRDGWLQTGDQGRLVDGELVVTGRLKELMILAGRNVAPEPIEHAGATVPGIRKGGVAAFSVPYQGTERLVVVAETAKDVDHVEPSAVSDAIHERTGERSRVYLVPAKTLPKTTSGKMRRLTARQMFLDGELTIVD